MDTNVVSLKVIKGMLNKRERIVVGLKTKIYDYAGRYFPSLTKKIVKKTAKNAVK